MKIYSQLINRDMKIINNIRIKQYQNGFLVEKASTNFLGIKKWKCCVTYSGLDEPFYFKTLNGALDSVMVDVKQDIFEISEVWSS